jgi:hypothetical protein
MVATDRRKKIVEIFIVPLVKKIESIGAAILQRSMVIHMRRRIISVGEEEKTVIDQVNENE